MKTSRSLLALMLLGILGIFIYPVFSGSSEGKVFSKRRNLPLLESASSSAKEVAKAEWNESLSVLQRQGRWIKVASKDGEGWVYQGSVSSEAMKEENMNDMPLKADNMNATAAGRGWLSEGANEYADRHSHGDVAEQMKWAGKINNGVSKQDARDYLKSHNLGEFAEAK
jgi:hypothetical protein